MINKNDLNDYFISGIKHKKNLKIGVEHEKFVLDKDSLFFPEVMMKIMVSEIF